VIIIESFTIDKYLNLKKQRKWKKIANETWFDWFGTRQSLTNKSKKLAGFTTRIIKKYIPEKDYKKWEILYKETVPMWTTGFVHTGWIQRIGGRGKKYWFSISWGDNKFQSGNEKSYDSKKDQLKIRR